MINYDKIINNKIKKELVPLVCEKLHEKKKDGFPHASRSILGKIEKLLKTNIGDKEKEFLKVFFINENNLKDFSKIKNIIESNVSELEILKIKIEDYIASDKTGFSKDEEFYRELKKNFINSYENKLRGNSSIMAKYTEIFSDSKLTVCPLCNCQKIFEGSKNDLKFIGTLDHFWEKSDYPYLAVSVFNLIPACERCNKRKEETRVDRKEIILEENYHAYYNDLHKISKFDFSYLYYNFRNKEFTGELIIREQNKKSDQNKTMVLNHDVMYGFSNRYKSYSREVDDMWEKIRSYKEDYIKHCKKILKIAGMEITDKDISRCIDKDIGGPINQNLINEYERGKLIYDFKEEFCSFLKFK